MSLNHLWSELSRSSSKDARQADALRAERLIEGLFPAQRNFVLDRARNKAGLCPRRAGKSFCCLSYALYVALTKPGARTLIICKVRKQARVIYWQALKNLCEQLEIHRVTKFRNHELEAELHNGSMIYFSGADTMDEIEKFRGGSYDLVIVDECKSYAPHLLNELISDVIKPSLLDRRGTLALIGTPGAILQGPFFDITTCKKTKVHGLPRLWSEWQGKGRAPRWSVHKWTSAHNIYCPHIWADALQDKADAEWPDDHPTWVREYLGEWVPDDEALVYAYARANLDGRCDWEPVEEADNPWGLPPGHNWQFLLGLDLGYHDDTALVVAAWADTHPSLHYVHVEKHSSKDNQALTVEALANRIKSLEESFGGFMARVADTGGLGKFIVESLASTYDVSFHAAKKSEKHDHIKILNSDLMAGRIKVHQDSSLAEEWLTLQWAAADRRIEDPSCPNHAADAALYLWRYAHHHLWTEQIKAPSPGTEDWWAQKQADDRRRYRDELLARRNEQWWESVARSLDRTPDDDEGDIWNSSEWLS